MEKLIRAAEDKFGAVEESAEHKNGGFVFMILRQEPANPAFPYMTIRGILSPGGSADFCWGHYDMTEEQARKDFATR